MSLEVKKYTLEMLSLLIASLDKNELKEEYVTLQDYNNLKSSLVVRLEEINIVVGAYLKCRPTNDMKNIKILIERLLSELK